jgi:hypothetical protein
VYDIDGTATASLDTLRDPGLTTAAQRPARFLRVIKAVSLPDRDVLDIDNSAFGASSFMREIIGYAPVEPEWIGEDEVPANIAFGVEVLDANSRRISQPHLNWMTLKAGEVVECSGCTRAPANCLTVVRCEAPSVNAGAPSDGSPFPNTEPTLFANAGKRWRKRTRAFTACRCRTSTSGSRRVDRSERARERCELRVCVMPR